MSTLPITDLMTLATAVAGLGNGVDALAANGTDYWKDLAEAPALLSALKAFGEVDYAQLLPELTDLDDAESKQLADHFAEVFNLRSDAVEATVETGLNLILKVYEAVKAWRSLKPANA